MPEEDVNSKNEAQSRSSINKSFLWGGGLALVFVILANQQTTPTDEQLHEQTGHISAQNCVAKINSITQYARARLKVSNQTGSAVYVGYRNDFGRVFKFRCQGADGIVQLYAEGAGMWMGM